MLFEFVHHHLPLEISEDIFWWQVLFGLGDREQDLNPSLASSPRICAPLGMAPKSQAFYFLNCKT